jgi:hypothetical protein
MGSADQYGPGHSVHTSEYPRRARTWKPQRSSRFRAQKTRENLEESNLGSDHSDEYYPYDASPAPILRCTLASMTRHTGPKGRACSGWRSTRGLGLLGRRQGPLPGSSNNLKSFSESVGARRARARARARAPLARPRPRAYRGRAAASKLVLYLELGFLPDL